MFACCRLDLSQKCREYLSKLIFFPLTLKNCPLYFVRSVLFDCICFCFCFFFVLSHFFNSFFLIQRKLFFQYFVDFLWLSLILILYISQFTDAWFYCKQMFTNIKKNHHQSSGLNTFLYKKVQRCILHFWVPLSFDYHACK